MMQKRGDMKRIFILVLSTLLFAGCQNQAVKENRELAKEVIAIHDEAMAKMTHMHELKLSLQKIEANSGQAPEITKIITDLQSAHKGMMTWMHEYKSPETDDEFKKAKEYLLAEKVQIQQVKTDIDASIIQAEDLLH